MPPDGGKLCRDCMLPVAVESNRMVDFPRYAYERMPIPGKRYHCFWDNDGGYEAMWVAAAQRQVLYVDGGYVVTTGMYQDEVFWPMSRIRFIEYDPARPNLADIWGMNMSTRVWFSACPGGCGFEWLSPHRGEVEMVHGSHSRGCEGLKRLILDEDYFNEDTRTFGFKDQPERFKWAPGSKVVFVYYSAHPDVTKPFAVFHVKKADPEVADVQAECRDWLKGWREGMEYMEVAKMKGVIPLGPKPPDGPHCRKCLKVDEGDTVPDPKDADKLLCMVCLIEEARL